MSRQNYLLIPLLATIIFLTLLAVAVVPMVITVVEVPAALQDDTRALEMAANGLELAAKENLSVGDEFVLNLDGLSATVRIFDDAGQPTVESIGQAGEASRRLTALFSEAGVPGNLPDDIVFLPGDFTGAITDGDVVDDLSNYGNEATSSNVESTIVAGPWGGNVNTLAFDGRQPSLPGDGDFLIIADSPELRWENEGSLSGWFFIDADTGKRDAAIFFKGTNRNNFDYGLFLDGENRNGGPYRAQFRITADNGTEYIVESSQLLNDGDWYHISGGWKGNRLEIYINGVLSNSFTAPLTLQARTSNRNVYIGNYNPLNNNDEFVGLVYFPVMVSRLILPVEVQSLFQDRRLYYQFNGVGTAGYPGDGENRLIDSTIYLNHGEIFNGPILLTADSSGNTNEAFDFNENNFEYITSDETYLGLAQNFTVALDVKREELFGVFRDQFFFWGDFLNVEFGSTSFIFGDYTQIRSSTFGIALDRGDVGRAWMRMHITYDGNRAIFYLNGTEIDRDNNVSGSFSTDAQTVILKIGDETISFDGEVAAVAIYGRVLSNNEIQNLSF